MPSTFKKFKNWAKNLIQDIICHTIGTFMVSIIAPLLFLFYLFSGEYSDQEVLFLGGTIISFIISVGLVNEISMFFDRYLFDLTLLTEAIITYMIFGFLLMFLLKILNMEESSSG